MSAPYLRVLIIDDQKHDYELARRALLQHHADTEVLWAQRGEDGLRRMAEETFDIVVLDYEMPGLNGLEVLIKMRARLMDLPTIFITGNGDEATAVRALKLGARDYLVKDTVGHYLERLPFTVKRICDQSRNEQMQEHISNELQRRNDRLRATIASMDDLVFVIDRHDEFVSYYQPPGKHSLSATPEFFLGQVYADVLPQHVSELVNAGIISARETGEAQHFEYPLRLTTTTYWFEAKLTLRRDRKGQYDGVTIVVRDITARKQAETVLRRYNLELEQRVKERTLELTKANKRLKGLDQLRAKLIDDMAHELRTPITNLKLYLDLLYRNQGSAKVEHYFEVLFRQAERLEEMIMNIVNFSEIQAQEQNYEMLDLVEIARKLLAAYKVVFETRQLDCRLETAVPTAFIWGSEEQISTMLSILLKNAIDYTVSGSIVLTLDQKEGMILIAVKDTGIGIPEEDIPHIFERFYRGSNVGQLTYPGSGIGLAILKELLLIYRGDAAVESMPGQGTQFSLRLPPGPPL